MTLETIEQAINKAEADLKTADTTEDRGRLYDLAADLRRLETKILMQQAGLTWNDLRDA